MTTKIIQHTPIDPQSFVPLYLQIARHITEQIRSGAFRAGDRLPSAHEIVKRYNVSTITARAAIKELHSDGIAISHQGRGTYVREASDAETLWQVAAAGEGLLAGSHSEVQVVWRKQAPAAKWLADRFALSQPSAVYTLRTVRTLDEKPYMVTDIFHPPFVGQTLTDQDYDELVQHKRLVSGIVEERCGIEVANINLHIGAEAADTGIAKMLDVDRGKPLLVIDREFVASDGTVVQIGRSRYATKAGRYMLNLRRVAGPRSTTRGDKPAVPRSDRAIPLLE